MWLSNFFLVAVLCCFGISEAKKESKFRGKKSRYDVFQEKYLKAVHLKQKKKYKKAYKVIRQAKPREHLAKLYQKILMGDLMVALNKVNIADSLYSDAWGQIKKTSWKRYLAEKRYRVFDKDTSFSIRKREYYKEQVQAKSYLPDSVQISVLLQLLKHSESWTVRENYLEKLFLLDPLDPRLKEAYKKYVHNKAYSKNIETNFSIAQYEEATHKYKKAANRILYILKKTKLKKEQKRARKVYIQLTLKTGDYENGIRSGKKYVRLYKDDPDVLLNIARLYNAKKDKPKSRYWYNRFIKKFPDHKKTEEIYWIRGWEAEHAHNYEGAIRWYNKLLPRFESRKRGRWARFRIAFCYYKQKKYSKALAYFKKAHNQVEGRLSIPAASYWKGNTLKKMGKLDLAYQTYVETHKKYPYSFYGHLALKKIQTSPELESMGTGKKIWSLEWKGNEETEKWLLASKKKNRKSFYIGSPYFSIRDLLENGLDTLAKVTLESQYERYNKDVLFLYRYANLFQDKFPEFAYKLSRRLSYQISLEKVGQAPGELISLFFPLYHSEEIQEHGKKKKVPTHFVQALMKQESGFQAEVISRAGAIGLMQIMPTTGKNLANGLNVREYDPSYLRTPSFNVMLGVEYLRQLMKNYNSNLFLVLANYNAGPRPTKRWQKQNGHKPLDIFVEEVSYWETRDYLKKVMGNYWNYKLIYSGKEKSEVK